MAEYRCPCGLGATAPTIDGMLAAARDHDTAGCSHAPAPAKPATAKPATERPALAVQIPSVPSGPKGVPTDQADVAYYRSAARNIRYAQRNGQSFAGSNLTETVARLCEAAADALEARTEPELTPDEYRRDGALEVAAKLDQLATTGWQITEHYQNAAADARIGAGMLARGLHANGRERAQQ